MARKPATRPDVYQLKITLAGSKPAIWRRMLVPSDFALEELHWVIQAAMPWTNSHLHQFHGKDGARYADTRFGLDDVRDEAETELAQVLVKPKDRIAYEYDFGDGWEHLIVLEKVLPAEPKQKLPACVDGRRAAPPDDCGGIWGYEHLLEVLADPDHDEHDDMMEWIGGAWDAGAFNPKDFRSHMRRLGLH